MPVICSRNNYIFVIVIIFMCVLTGWTEEHAPDEEQLAILGDEMSELIFNVIFFVGIKIIIMLY